MSDAKFFHTPYFVSSVVAHAIYELGIEDKVEVVTMGFQDMKGEFHLKKHPQGKIPFYTEGDFTLIESSAILLYILEKYDTEKKLTNFVDIHQRGKFYQFLLNCPTQIYPNFVQLYAHRVLFPAGHPARSEGTITSSVETWHLEIAPFVVAQLGSQQYILGEEFTAADCLVGYNVLMGELLGEISEYPTLVAYLERLRARPAFAKCFTEENKQYLPTLERYADSLQRKGVHMAELRAARAERLEAAKQTTHA
ncbi:hypothetical protein SAMD00019534_029650 [Acytostelium subglobosum LB1]|uniref:hypothetical protein n=1 Tax=Acytostelium subglobosum LB1 TaxID=1410327 RepID=UPI0006451028|nr:hypothetical protein SAMD00019534_029650 [Acytostelium subglobosum LB1]GAM19790.1 hypothetical protein SAMD00019534_029650 [Acytostelium subglobosum LB1]|eukprot:XP_012756552.1 hypothetical protein SAMD00019534_029650 [Acytostelium subglobosum LB1]